MGRSDRPYVFTTHSCYQRHGINPRFQGGSHPDFCAPPGRRRRRITSKARRRDAARIIRTSLGE